MAPPARHRKLLDKAVSALIAAIDTYNRADSAYREETFYSLAVNAWELHLKAKLLQQKRNNMTTLYVLDRRRRKDGNWSTRRYYRRNRSGGMQPISLGGAIERLEHAEATRLHPDVKANIDGLVTIRDNAVHLMNNNPTLQKTVLEIGTATVMNFVELCKRWFAYDFSGINLYLMPMGLLQTPSATGVILSNDEAALLEYLLSLMEPGSEDDNFFHVGIDVDIRLTRSSSGGLETAITNSPGAHEIRLSEEDIKDRYPWDHHRLTVQLRARYSDFSLNSAFYSTLKAARADVLDGKVRELDPGNPKSSKKWFYNPNIVGAVFDRQYTLRP